MAFGLQQQLLTGHAIHHTTTMVDAGTQDQLPKHTIHTSIPVESKTTVLNGLRCEGTRPVTASSISYERLVNVLVKNASFLTTRNDA